MPKLFRSALLLVILSVPLFATEYPARAQVASESRNANTLRFDVVSIRPHAGPRGSVQTLPDGYEAIGWPLSTTIIIAYAPAPFFKHLDDVKGLPKWATEDLYDIRAKIAPEEAERWRALSKNMMQNSPLLQQMLQPVLAERCNLRIHGEQTKADALALTVTAKSPALVEDSTVPAGGEGNQLPEGARMIFSKAEMTYSFYNTPMSLLANYLTPFATSTVEDRTGLQGRYKFTLHRIVATTPEGDTSTQVADPVPFDLRSIGLKADKIKVDATRWTVDSIDKPTAN